MTISLALRRGTIAATLAAALICGPAAMAQNVTIQVANYNDGMSGQIWAVVLERGYAKELGLNLEVRASTGGSADVRSLVAGDLPYVESGLIAAVSAVEQGVDLKIVSDNAVTFGSTAWFALASSPVNKLADLKGHKLSYSNPKSGTQIVDMMLLKKLGYTEKDVTLVPAGGLSASLTMLEAGGIDVVTAGIQIFYAAPPGKYKLIGIVGQELPPLNNVVALSTGKAIKEQPEVIRKLILARRKAVEFLEKNPDEAAEDMARVAKWDVPVTKKVVNALKAPGSFWSLGGFGKAEDMDNAIAGFVLVGAIEKPFDWRKIADEQFLPADLRSLKK